PVTSARLAHRPARRLDPARRPEPDPLASWPSGRFRWVALPYRLDQRTTPPKVVCQHRPLRRQGSLLPLWGQQPGQHVVPTWLPGPRGAGAHAGKPRPALGCWLRAVRGIGRRLCRAPMALAGFNPTPRSKNRRPADYGLRTTDYRPLALDHSSLRTVEPDAECDNLHHDRDRRHPPVVGDPPGHLFAQLYPRFRPQTALAAPPDGSCHAADGTTPDHRHALRSDGAGWAAHRAAPAGAVRHRHGLSRRSGAEPACRGTCDGVLSLAVRRRASGGTVQRLARALGVQRDR